MMLRRVAFIVPVSVAVSVGLFALGAVSPFDPLRGYLGSSYVTTSDADKAAIGSQLELNLPWHQAYGQWVSDLADGDLGAARSYGQPVSEVLAERVPWTLLLAGLGLLCAAALALLVGVTAGLRSGGLFDRITSAVCIVVQGLPPFVLTLGGIALFAVTLKWLPVAGLTDAGAEPTVEQVSRHLILPVSVLALSQLPWLLLAVRESVVAAKSEDFVAGAVARGIPTRTIVCRHIVPMSLGPFVNIVGARLPELVVGAALVEEIFGWPGIAGAVITAAKDLDMALLATLVVGTTVVVMLGSLLADVAVTVLDPRVVPDG